MLTFMKGTIMHYDEQWDDGRGRYAVAFEGYNGHGCMDQASTQDNMILHCPDMNGWWCGELHLEVVK